MEIRQGELTITLTNIERQFLSTLLELARQKLYQEGMFKRNEETAQIKGFASLREMQQAETMLSILFDEL